MPTYEYLCMDCGFKFEEFQSIAAEPLHVCPKCKGNSVRRLISGGGGIIFKGHGFYQTDYKNKSFAEPSHPTKEAMKAKSEAAENPKKSEDAKKKT